MVGMANRALKGSAAIMLFASSFPDTTRAVVYTELTVTAQLPINRQIINAFAIAERSIPARSTRDSTSVVTNPSSDS